MKTLLVVYLAFLSSCLFYSPAYAFSDRCIDIEQRTGLDLNEAECYVLEKVEKGEVAHFKQGENLKGRQLFKAKFQDRFIKIEDRTISADFLNDLLTGTLSNLKVVRGDLKMY